MYLDWFPTIHRTDVDPAPEGAAKRHRDTGHATLLVNQEDDVTGLEYVELLDLLVERTHPMRPSAESKLVTASWQFAQSQDKPLLGHIVVREKTCHCAGVGLLILDRLETRGWAFRHN